MRDGINQAFTGSSVIGYVSRATQEHERQQGELQRHGYGAGRCGGWESWRLAVRFAPERLPEVHPNRTVQSRISRILLQFA